MNPPSNSRPGGRETNRAADEVDTKSPQGAPVGTPRTDMQDVDAGTAASGNDGRANAAESVMKQEHKTEHESGSRR